MPLTLRDHLLRVEARVAMLEDQVAFWRARMRDWLHIGAVVGELLLLLALVAVINRWESL